MDGTFITIGVVKKEFGGSPLRPFFGEQLVRLADIIDFTGVVVLRTSSSTAYRQTMVWVRPLSLSRCQSRGSPLYSPTDETTGRSGTIFHDGVSPFLSDTLPVVH